MDVSTDAKEAVIHGNLRSSRFLRQKPLRTWVSHRLQEQVSALRKDAAELRLAKPTAAEAPLAPGFASSLTLPLDSAPRTVLTSASDPEPAAAALRPRPASALSLPASPKRDAGRVSLSRLYDESEKTLEGLLRAEAVQRRRGGRVEDVAGGDGLPGDLRLRGARFAA